MRGQREFEIQDGRLRLRRSIDLREKTIEGKGLAEQSWFLEVAVTGMAGAVSLGIEFGNHRPTQAWVLDQANSHAVTYAPTGVFVHAYRPIPDEREDLPPEPCSLLYGGKCFARQHDDLCLLESEPLVTMMGQPDGIDAVWRHLEGVYREEFVPAEHPAVIAQRERERGAEIAEARQEGRLEGMHASAGALSRESTDVHE